MTPGFSIPMLLRVYPFDMAYRYAFRINLLSLHQENDMYE